MALAELGDTGVATLTVFGTWSDDRKEFSHRVVAVDVSFDEPAGVDIATFAESHHFLSKGAHGFGFGESGFDLLVLDQADDEICEKRITMVSPALEFYCLTTVSHRISRVLKVENWFYGRARILVVVSVSVKVLIDQIGQAAALVLIFLVVTEGGDAGAGGSSSEGLE